jgi:hypothetical protein
MTFCHLRRWSLAVSRAQPKSGSPRGGPRSRISLSIPRAVTELRACLFFEQRRRNQVGEGIEVEQVPYENAIYERLEALRLAPITAGDASRTPHDREPDR